jgi:hypothetical protein
MAHCNSKNRVDSKQYALKSFAAYFLLLTLFSFCYELSTMSHELSFQFFHKIRKSA